MKNKTNICGFVAVNGIFTWIPFRTHKAARAAGAVRFVRTIKQDGRFFPAVSTAPLGLVGAVC
jgi:hypothetical protein